MFYTTEEAAVLGGFVELYLEREQRGPGRAGTAPEIPTGAAGWRTGTGRL